MWRELMEQEGGDEAAAEMKERPNRCQAGLTLIFPFTKSSLIYFFLPSVDLSFLRH